MFFAELLRGYFTNQRFIYPRGVGGNYPQLPLVTQITFHSISFRLPPPDAANTGSSPSTPVSSLCSSPSSPNPSDAAGHSGRHGKKSGQVMDDEDRSVDPELDPLFSYPQIPSVFPPPTSHEAAAGVSVGRGSSPAPRVGLARPPPAAPPVASVQGGMGGGRPGPAAGRSGQAAPQATADQRPLACASRKRPLPAKKKDEQVLLLAVKLQYELHDALNR